MQFINTTTAENLLCGKLLKIFLLNDSFTMYEIFRLFDFRESLFNI